MNPVVDTIGTEIYTAHYHERRTSRWALGIAGVVVLFQLAVIVQLAGRPVVTRYIRIDEVGHAVPIAYNDLNYSPREGEIRTFLTDWATFRYTRLAGTVAKMYPKNFLF